MDQIVFLGRLVWVTAQSYIITQNKKATALRKLKKKQEKVDCSISNISCDSPPEFYRTVVMVVMLLWTQIFCLTSQMGHRSKPS